MISLMNNSKTSISSTFLIKRRLQQMCVNESMQNVMSGMAKIMSGASNKMKGKDYQETIKKFMTEKERMNVMNEYVEDIMG